MLTETSKDPIFAERLKEARKARGLTQDEVVEALGLRSKTLVSHYETGNARPQAKVLLQMCQLYEIDPMSLLG